VAGFLKYIAHHIKKGLKKRGMNKMDIEEAKEKCGLFGDNCCPYLIMDVDGWGCGDSNIALVKEMQKRGKARMPPCKIVKTPGFPRFGTEQGECKGNAVILDCNYCKEPYAYGTGNIEELHDHEFIICPNCGAKGPTVKTLKENHEKTEFAKKAQAHYKTLEQGLMELFKSRGLEVESILVNHKSGDTFTWTITATGDPPEEKESKDPDMNLIDRFNSLYITKDGDWMMYSKVFGATTILKPIKTISDDEIEEKDGG